MISDMSLSFTQGCRRVTLLYVSRADNQPGVKCLKLHHEKEMWPVAKAKCIAESGRLVEMTTEEEVEKVGWLLAQGRERDGLVWTGGQALGTPVSTPLTLYIYVQV